MKNKQQPMSITDMTIDIMEFPTTFRTLNEAVRLAEERPEHPALRQIGHQMDPTAGHRDGQVGDGEIDQVIVGRRVHATTAVNGDDHRQVSDQRRHDYDRVRRDFGGRFRRRYLLQSARIRYRTGVGVVVEVIASVDVRSRRSR